MTTNGNGKRTKTTLTPIQSSEELESLLKEEAALETKEQLSEVNKDPKHVTLNQDSTGIKKAALEQLENNPGIQPHQPSTGTEKGCSQEGKQPNNPNLSVKERSQLNGVEIDNNMQPTAEELLKAAKAATKEQPPKEEKPKTETTGGTVDPGNSAFSALAQVTASAAQDLVNISEETQNQAATMMLNEGYQDVAAGGEQAYQAGMLLAIAHIKAKNTNDLSEQLGLLRQHTNAKSGESLVAALNQTGLIKKQVIFPLEIKVEETPKLKII